MIISIFRGEMNVQKMKVLNFQQENHCEIKDRKLYSFYIVTAKNMFKQ